jgi:hypothetical protein
VGPVDATALLVAAAVSWPFVATAVLGGSVPVVEVPEFSVSVSYTHLTLPTM